LKNKRIAEIRAEYALRLMELCPCDMRGGFVTTTALAVFGGLKEYQLRPTLLELKRKRLIRGYRSRANSAFAEAWQTQNPMYG
jgi:hypothetical protein